MLKKILYLLLIFLCLLSAESVLFAQAQDGPRQPIILRHADSLLGTTVGNEFVRELIGNVDLEQGNVTVQCDKAIHYTQENRVTVIGNVVIRQGTVTMRMPRGEFYGNQDYATGEQGVKIEDRKQNLVANKGVYSTKTATANFVGDVHVWDDSVDITCETAVYKRATQESEAFGKVVLRSKTSRSVMYGDTAYNFPNRQYSLVLGRPKLLQIDSSFSTPTKLQSSADSLIDSISQRTVIYDSLIIVSDTLENFREESNKKLHARGNVELLRTSIKAKAQSLEYNMSKEHIILLGAPIVWADSMQLYADSIWVQVPNKKLKNIHALRSGFLGMRNDSINIDRINQIMGDAIYISVDADTLKHIRSVKNARSLYFMEGEKGPDGTTRSACDSLIVHFAEQTLDDIVWRGGVQSEYFPENLVGGKTQTYYLPAFKWSETPPKNPFMQVNPAVKEDTSSVAPQESTKKLSKKKVPKKK